MKQRIVAMIVEDLFTMGVMDSAVVSNQMVYARHLLKRVDQLPDDEHQEPSIPVSVIRAELERVKECWPQNSERAFGTRFCCDHLLRWIGEQTQPQPEPEAGDGWVSNGGLHSRDTKNGDTYSIREVVAKEPTVYAVDIGPWFAGIRPTLESAKALADEFAEANGGWAS